MQLLNTFPRLLALLLIFGWRRAACEEFRNLRPSRHAGRVARPTAGNLTLVVEYVDGLFANHATARAKLAGNFTKRSNVSVFYICYNRGEIINVTLGALLASEGLSSSDLFVVQDGGGNYTIDKKQLEPFNHVFIQHPVNLCAGINHYFVKRFGLEIMGYESIMVIEEDNLVHPQAVQMLKGMLEMTRNDPDIGVVGITDKDNSMVLNTTRYSNAVIHVPVVDGGGHLWVFGMHASTYHRVKHHLHDYYNTIKTYPYSMLDVPPLRDMLDSLYANKNFPPGTNVYSQDRFFVNSLARVGCRYRLVTMVRLFEPMGHWGLHFRQTPEFFFSIWGTGMYKGRLNSTVPYHVGKDPQAVRSILKECRKRLDELYNQYLARPVEPEVAHMFMQNFLRGEANAVALVRRLKSIAEDNSRRKGQQGVPQKQLDRKEGS